MKHIYAGFLFFSVCITLFSQIERKVGIGSDQIREGALIDIQVKNKGVLLPQVNISDLKTYAPLSGTAVDAMMVYNTNTTTGKGYYYWDAASNGGNGSWTPIVVPDDAPNQLLLSQNIVDYSGNSTTISSFPASPWTYNIGQTIGNQTEPFTYLDEEVTVFPKTNSNTVAIIAEGYAQQSGSGNFGSSFAVGIFVNDVLRFVKSFALPSNVNCAYVKYRIISNIIDVPKNTSGTKIRIGVSNRSDGNGTGVTAITYNGLASGCTNLDAATLQGLINVEISEN